MEPEKITGIKVKCTLDFKGGSREINDLMPYISKNEDYVKQYIGIWKIIFDKVKEFNAKSVLEFGTREGYSTRLFAAALKPNEGRIVTVDMNEPKEPFTEDNILVVTSHVENYPGFPCDILFIDDWHNGHHLYYELNKFAPLARVVLVHDICLDKDLLNSFETWCIQNMMIYTIYPMNGCGLGVIEVEKSGLFYANKEK